MQRSEDTETITDVNVNKMLVTGTSKGDVLVGTKDNDLIVGFGGRDTLIGGQGNDTLIGGSDGDLLTGGEGNDQFVYNSFSERTDIITDFNPKEDSLVLTKMFVNLNYKGVHPITDGYIKFLQQASSTIVQVDPDGMNGLLPFMTLVVLENVTAGSLGVGSNVII